MADKVLRLADWKSVAAAIPSEDDPLFGKKLKERHRALHGQIELASGAKIFLHDCDSAHPQAERVMELGNG